MPIAALGLRRAPGAGFWRIRPFIAHEAGEKSAGGSIGAFGRVLLGPWQAGFLAIPSNSAQKAIIPKNGLVFIPYAQVKAGSEEGRRNSPFTPFRPGPGF